MNVKLGARYRTHRASRGLSLVELLVSILLGLVLSAGMVSAYLTAKRSYAFEEQTARMQENGRYAMRLLSRELMMAGFYGGLPTSTQFAARSVDVDCSDWNWALDGSNPLDFIDDYSGQSPPLSLYQTAFTCLDVGGISLSTDLLAVKRTAAQASLSRGVPADSLTASTIASWYLRLVSGRDPTWERLRPIELRDGARALPSLSYWEAITRVFFIRSYSSQHSDDIPSLCMETLAADQMTSRCLVEGVENQQFEFGIDTDGDGAPNRYKSAPTASDMQRAVTVKVHLLLRSITALPGHRDDKTYRLGNMAVPAAHDGYLRRVVSSTVVLRNHKAPAG